MDLDLSKDFEDYWPGSESGSTVEVRNTFLHVGKNESDINSKIWASDFVCNYRELELEAISGGQTTKSRRRRPGKKARTRMARRSNSNCNGHADLSDTSPDNSMRASESERSLTGPSKHGLDDMSQSLGSDPQQVFRVGEQVADMSPAYIRPSSALSSELPRANRKPRRSVSFGDVSPHCIAVALDVECEGEKKQSMPCSVVEPKRASVGPYDEQKSSRRTSQEKEIRTHSTQEFTEEKLTNDSAKTVAITSIADKSPNVSVVAPTYHTPVLESTAPSDKKSTNNAGSVHKSAVSDPWLQALVSPNVTGALLVVSIVMLLWVAGIIQINIGSAGSPQLAADTVVHLREEMELRMASQEQRLKELVSELQTARQSSATQSQHSEIDGAISESTVGSAHEQQVGSIDRTLRHENSLFDSSEEVGWWNAKLVSLIWLSLVVLCLLAQLLLKRKHKEA